MSSDRRYDPAFPKPASPRDGANNDQEGVSTQTYLVAKFAAAWIPALAARRDGYGYDDASASVEAIRLAVTMADFYLTRYEQ